ncbi:hypothetical protein ACIP6X_43795 [Streptomyces coeruleorubidus]|uniref:hypothetical protein n=1 Tax=Streptomyces coeruleorubidus TaxID=116188 RepID=UPI00381F8077
MTLHQLMHQWLWQNRATIVHQTVVLDKLWNHTTTSPYRLRSLWATQVTACETGTESYRLASTKARAAVGQDAAAG